MFTERVEEYIRSIDDIFHLHRLYLPIYMIDGEGFELIIVDFEQKLYFLLNPFLLDTAEAVLGQQQKTSTIQRNLNRILSMLECICSLIILEMFYYDLPIVFREEDIEFIRKAFFYHLLNGKLPQVRILICIDDEVILIILHNYVIKVV